MFCGCTNSFGRSATNCWSEDVNVVDDDDVDGDLEAAVDDDEEYDDRCLLLAGDRALAGLSCTSPLEPLFLLPTVRCCVVCSAVDLLVVASIFFCDEISFSGWNIWTFGLSF